MTDLFNAVFRNMRDIGRVVWMEVKRVYNIFQSRRDHN